MNILDILKSKSAMSERRLEICSECEHLNKTLMQCKKCGCFMHGKSKFPSASCPVGKWGPEEEINT
jgi:hypothetical protein